MSLRGAYLLLGAIILLWGSNWPIMKIGLDEGIPPFWFAVSRLFLGMVTLLALLAALGRISLPRRSDLPVIFTVGLLQVALFLGAINFALQYVEAGRSSVLAYTTPLWVAPAAILILGERPSRLKVGGLLLGLAGLIALFNPLALDWSDPDVVTGNLILMLAAVGWAIAILHVRGHRWSSSVLQVIPWQMMVALVPLTALALIFEGDYRPDLSTKAWVVIAYNGPIATGFCYWATITVTRSLPAISTSLGLLGVPLVGVGSSALLLGEALTPSLLMGLLGIVAGLALVNMADLRAQPDTMGKRDQSAEK
ncbi:DMT family transporter [Fodinicurvata sediminis]|uniref:DMT family transporter n=1 Tax=Fodinicurvata sediminis TaxID=1121832 RepID=UPI0003B3B924|nr:DMT family transporter [Fodinicurvata sediminis]